MGSSHQSHFVHHFVVIDGQVTEDTAEQNVYTDFTAGESDIFVKARQIKSVFILSTIEEKMYFEMKL